MSVSIKIHSSSEIREDKIQKVNQSNVTKLSKKGKVRKYLSEKNAYPADGRDVFVLNKFFHLAPYAIITTDCKKKITSYNKSAEALFGYRQDEVLGKEISILFTPDREPQKSKISNHNQSEPYWHGVTAVSGHKKNGEHIPIEVMLTEYTFDQTPVHIYCVKDATVFFRQEQQIAELQREIAYLSQHSILGELATAITHELSQPLSAITNYVAAASRSWSQSSDNVEYRLELINKAGEQAKRAWLTVHRLRKLIQHRGAECTDDDLRLALEEAIQLATLGASQHGIAIEVDVPSEPVMVHMDHVQIQVLLANLIRNAIDELRAWKGERKLWISLKINEQNLAEVVVADTGPGIAQDVFENIFDPFLTTKPEGLGVGLAVSRRIAKTHGGRLLARNRPEGGAAFSFFVPVSMSGKVNDE